MNPSTQSRRLRLTLACALLGLGAAACGDSDTPATSTTTAGSGANPAPPAAADPATPPVPTSPHFEMTAVNLTAAQPLSPPAVIVHGSAYQIFTLGQAVSTELEALAEGADTGPLVTAAKNNTDVATTAVFDTGPVAPGASASTMVTLPAGVDLAGLEISAATMLVNTNDAIAALRGTPLGDIKVGESATFFLNSYDTGSEANSEAAATIPGPAGGGTGFDTTRDDIIDAVLPHPGVISADDGLAGSTLQENHRWQDPAVMVRIRRLQ